MMRVLAILLLLNVAVGCRDTDEADPDLGGNQDATADQRDRPDAVEQDETEDTAVEDQTQTDMTPDLVEDTTPDLVEDTTADVVEDTTTDESEDVTEGDQTGDPDVAEVDAGDDSDVSDVADTSDMDSTGDPDVTSDPDVITDGSDLGSEAFIIVEIGGNPQATSGAPLSDEEGEFIEVYNNTDGPLALASIVFAYTEWTGDTPPATSDEKVVVTSDYTVPAHTLAVLGRTNLPDTTGYTPDGIYSPTASIFNGTDISTTRARVRLLSSDTANEADSLIDEVLIPVGTFGNDNRGRTWQLSFTDGDSPVPEADRSVSNWCSTPAIDANEYRDDDWGTPGEANLVCE